jgi:hypothetical protein
MNNFERTWSEISCCGLKLLPVDIAVFFLNESPISSASDESCLHFVAIAIVLKHQNPSGGIPCSPLSVSFQFIRKFLRRWCDLSTSSAQSLRVERAVHFLKTNKASIEEIAAKVGHMDGGTLRLLLRRRLNLGVKEIRRTTKSKRFAP